jgi:hypothetical protein
MAAPLASNAALSLEFLDRHTGSSLALWHRAAAAAATVNGAWNFIRARTFGNAGESIRAARRRLLMARSPAMPDARTAWGPRFAALAVAAAFSLPIMPATYAAEPPGSAADRGNQPSTDAGPSGNLSERLNQSGGVIKPPENVDPGLQKKPPDDSSKMPVIPPPGSPGGDPNVKPK